MNSRKGKGIPFNSYDVSTLGATAKLFNNKEIVIVGSKAEIHQEVLMGGKKVECHIETVPIEQIFSKIRKLFDQSNMIIAERTTPRGRLLSTGKGVTKEHMPPRALEVQWALTAKRSKRKKKLS